MVVAPGHSSASMASTGPRSAWCLQHAALVSTIRSHFNASLAVFISSTFIIPGLVLVLVAMVSKDIAKDKASRQMAIRHSNSGTNLPANEDDTLRNDFRISNKSRIQTPQLMPAFKWPASTTLLAAAASLYAFQILLILFMCVDTAVGGVVVLVGALVWLIITLRFATDSALWCWTIISRAAKREGQSTPEHVRNTTMLSELQRDDERGTEEEGVRSPAPTLPPYLV